MKSHSLPFDFHSEINKNLEYQFLSVNNIKHEKINKIIRNLCEECPYSGFFFQQILGPTKNYFTKMPLL